MELAVPTSNSRKKLHVASTNNCAMVSRKVPKYQWGRLELLPELPLDIVFEIFAHLEPFDLLRLARSSKKMHAFLMRKNAASIWRTARTNVDGLPDCPPDMSEPQYANLVFSPHCHYCLFEPVNQIIWSNRVRACKQCFPLHFGNPRKYYLDSCMNSEQFALPRAAWKFANLYGKIIHSSVYLPITSQNTVREIAYLDVFQKLADEYAQIKDEASKVEEWLSKKNEAHDAWAAIAGALIKWHDGKAEKRSLELAAARQSRLDSILKNLNEEGFEKALATIGLDQLRDHKLVKVPKALTPHAWARIKPAITAFIDDRMEEFRLNVITGRRRTFAQYIAESPVHSASKVPIVEFMKFANIHSLMELSCAHHTLTTSHFPTPQALSAMTEFWRRDKRRELVKIMLQSSLAPRTATDHHIDLATSFFHWAPAPCGGPAHEIPIGQDAILVHPGAFSLRPQQMPGYDMHEQRLFGNFKQEYWNFGGDRVSFYERAHLAAVSVVRCCGCDPATVTAASMDQWNPLLECVSCTKPAGRLMMTWRRAVVHAIGHFHAATMHEWALADPADPAYGRAVDKICTASPKAHCHMCAARGERADIVSHVKNCHGNPQNVTVWTEPPPSVRVSPIFKEVLEHMW